ncbi:mechanosensitive ion channel domain-containing protein [Microcoleus sp. FACHB-68]|uniref:mechanosensitive ion channel domain-containing protein n=1 Tax=Microcoleus sp. FACHB-68 TaxID=2692826 RepID=UPI00321FB02E
MNSMNNLLQQLFTELYKRITEPFKIGDYSISISAVIQLCVLLLILIFICRTLKNFLKRRLLVKMGIDEGNREAISTIISYAVGTLGFIIVLQTSGFNLASLAVVAGGLGVGIGFGLQDITKNFVSGLTLLIERTVKVGDFVEFDSISGYIKEISIRSTIIRTLDGCDVVVPNSKLVENRLTNWTYESFSGRIHIPIGVAYESDPVLVTEILLKSAYMESNILHEPAPKVFFLGFGDNALNFELCVWVSRIDNRQAVRSSLNFIIEYNLRQQGITIPFPQRDLWLRNPEVLTPLSRYQANGQELPQVSPPQVFGENGQEPSQVSTPPILKETVKPASVVAPTKPLALRDLLREVTYFENFTDLELRQLIESGYRKRLRPSEFLFHEGDPGDAFYIVLSGSVEVFVEKINKRLANLGPGKFFGELSLMLGIPRTASVRGLEDSILFVINHQSFETLLRANPELAEVIVQELGKHKEELSQRQQQLREMGLVDAAEDDKNPVTWVRNRLKNLFSL